jgi:hypothetical protein
MIQFHRSAIKISGEEVLAFFQDQVRSFPQIHAVEIFIHTRGVMTANIKNQTLTSVRTCTVMMLFCEGFSLKINKKKADNPFGIIG